MILVDEHPLLEVLAFTTTFELPLGEYEGDPPWIGDYRHGADVALSTNDEVKKTVRDLLRHGGFKPAGRSKPSPEYLLKSAQDNTLPRINPVVDATNLVSLHSGLPMSVVDLDLATGPFRVGVADEASEYIFNPSGQVIDIGGLICLFDQTGPCANAVKDAQRTKTSASTTRSLSIIWGTNELSDRGQTAFNWYQESVAAVGGTVTVEATKAH